MYAGFTLKYSQHKHKHKYAYVYANDYVNKPALKVFGVLNCIGLHCARPPSLFVTISYVRSRCHVRRHLAVLALKKILVELPWWKRKYPILFECVTDKLIVITSVSPSWTDKACLRMRNVCIVLAGWPAWPAWPAWQRGRNSTNEGSYCGNWKLNQNCCSRYVG